MFYCPGPSYAWLMLHCRDKAIHMATLPGISKEELITFQGADRVPDIEDGQPSWLSYYILDILLLK